MKTNQKTLLPRWLRVTGGALLGMVGGIVYQQIVGCSGGCPITSSPTNSALFGMLTGIVAFFPFSPQKK